MDALQHRLAELADDAPTGGAPAAELWARGKRAHRLRAAAVAATVLVVAALGTGIGARLAAGPGNRSVYAPAGPVGFRLPIEYPVGEGLPNLSDTPGRLAAIWLAPRVGGGAPGAIGLVAETGTFGTLRIDLPVDDPQAPQDSEVALSPDGRWIAYRSSPGTVIVRDLVSGKSYSPLSEIETRDGFTWIDASHLVGHVAGGSDADGWVWTPGAAPKLVDPHPYLEGYGGRELWGGGRTPTCSAPTLYDRTGRVEVPVLCDTLGFIASEFVLGHPNGPDGGNGTVVALDIRGVTTHPFGGPTPRREVQFDDPALRHVVVAAGGPERVTFAADLIGEALHAAGGAS